MESLNKISLIAPCGMNCGLCVNYLAMKYDLKKQGFRKTYCSGCLPRGKNCTFMKNQCDLLGKGLGKIKAKFKDINAPGPVWLINFEDIDDEEEKNRVKRDAYERINAFLDTLGIEEFKERKH